MAEHSRPLLYLFGKNKQSAVTGHVLSSAILSEVIDGLRVAGLNSPKVEGVSNDTLRHKAFESSGANLFVDPIVNTHAAFAIGTYRAMALDERVESEDMEVAVRLYRTSDLVHRINMITGPNSLIVSKLGNSTIF